MKILSTVLGLLAVVALVAACARVPALARPVSAPTTKSAAPPRRLADVEEAIRQLVRAQGARPGGEIRAEADGPYSGSVDVGTGTRRHVDLVGPEFRAANGDADLLGDLLRELRVASRTDPQGPWYYVIVRADPDGTIDFEYFLENRPLASIKDLRLREYDFVPAHVYRQRFDPALVAELSDFEINAGIAAHVPHRIAAGKPVSPALLELFATIDWEGDVNNGGMDQYFARGHSDYTGAPRREMYPRVLAGLQRIGADDAARLFAESIALWAHFHPDVEQARVAMGIAAVPRQESSDIGGRYYALQRDLDRLRADYLRRHPEALTPAATAQ